MTHKKNASLHQVIAFGKHMVPGIWRYLLPYELSELAPPDERQATCMNCPKSNYEGYRADYRCCTYHPRVPNYMLGLANQGGQLHDLLQSMNEKGYLLPEGFVTTPIQWGQFLADVALDQFGASETVLCPFLERATGGCNIYAYRNGVCSTFFCEHDHGDPGNAFWDSLQSTVSQIELALGQWVLREAGFDVEAYFERLNGLAADVHSVTHSRTFGWRKPVRQYLWQEFFGRELALYDRCAEIVAAHKEDLWKIASGIDILEANDFDKAAIQVVPKEFQDHIDLEDFEPGATTPPARLWRKVIQSHATLWDLPKGNVVLNERVVIEPNPRDSAQDKVGKELVLKFLARKGGKEVAWKDYVTKKESAFFALFKSPQALSHDVMNRAKASLGGDPRLSLCEWYRRKVLIDAKN